MSHAVDSEELLVLAPIGRDAVLTCELLVRAGHTATACSSMEEVCARAPGAAALLVTEEAVTRVERERLVDALSRQPAWSDFPIVLFGASNGGRSHRTNEMIAALGNATLLERPIGVRPLLAAVRGALRARRRQYAARREIEQRDLFLAMLGHELRNPLAAVVLALEALQRTTDPVRTKRHIEVMKRQSSHLGRLVDDLLDVSRITAGKIELARAPLDLGEVVARCAVGFEQPVATSGLTLTIDVKGPAPVSGDAVRLEQVFANLLANAVKYTPAGGRIDVSVGTEGPLAVVRVRDSGVGIAAEMRGRIFELFIQAAGSLDRSRGGLGVGLTLVKSLVALHGGTIDVESDGLGKGSEFIVRMPRAGTAQPLVDHGEAIDGEAARGHDLRPRPIVLVDDSPDVRESLKEFLEYRGHTVQTAVDGPKGLACILDSQPVLALVDIGLPGIDGYEVARRVREALGSRIRLVAISGYGQPKDKAAAQAAGFDRHFTKPVDLHALEALIVEAVGI